MHHEYSKKKTPNEQEQQAKADKIVDAVLTKLDKDGDGKVAAVEFEAGGWEGLESFKDLGAEGHHYDVESGMRPLFLQPSLFLTLSIQSFSYTMRKCSIRLLKHRLSEFVGRFTPLF